MNYFSYNYRNGTILEAVEEDFAIASKLKEVDMERRNEKFISIEKQYLMTNYCMIRLYNLCENNKIDVIIVPLPVLLLFKEHSKMTLRRNKFFNSLTVMQIITIEKKIATCYLVDRVKKISSIDKFCQ